MARKPSYKVEYFPHRMAGEDMEHIQAMFGNDGYAVWFKILERIASTDYHILDLRTEKMISRCASKCLVSKDRLFDILNELALLEEIDADLWADGLIWSEKFIESVAPVYEKRSNKCLTKTEALEQIGITAPKTRQSAPETPQSDTGNTQSKVKYSKVEESKLNNDDAMQKEPKPKEVFTPENSFEKIHLGITEHHQPSGTNIADYVPAYEAWRDRSLVDTLFQSTYTLKYNTTVPEIKRLLNDFHHHIIATDKFHQTMSGWKRHFVSWLDIKKNAGEMKQIFKINRSNGE